MEQLSEKDSAIIEGQKVYGELGKEKGFRSLFRNVIGQVRDQIPKVPYKKKYFEPKKRVRERYGFGEFPTTNYEITHFPRHTFITTKQLIDATPPKLFFKPKSLHMQIKEAINKKRQDTTLSDEFRQTNHKVSRKGCYMLCSVFDRLGLASIDEIQSGTTNFFDLTRNFIPNIRPPDYEPMVSLPTLSLNEINAESIARHNREIQIPPSENHSTLEMLENLRGVPSQIALSIFSAPNNPNVSNIRPNVSNIQPNAQSNIPNPNIPNPSNIRPTISNPSNIRPNISNPPNIQPNPDVQSNIQKAFNIIQENQPQNFVSNNPQSNIQHIQTGVIQNPGDLINIVDPSNTQLIPKPPQANLLLQKTVQKSKTPSHTSSRGIFKNPPINVGGSASVSSSMSNKMERLFRDLNFKENLDEELAEINFRGNPSSVVKPTSFNKPISEHGDEGAISLHPNVTEIISELSSDDDDESTKKRKKEKKLKKQNKK